MRPTCSATPSSFPALIVGQNIWKETGYGTIIYLAALSSVDVQLYEAAKIDGAGRWQLMWHVTLPAIRGTIVLMLMHEGRPASEHQLRADLPDAELDEPRSLRCV